MNDAPSHEPGSQALPPDYLLKKFRVEAEIGAGGFGVTYRAYDIELHRHVAIKEYFPFNLAARDTRFRVAPKTRVPQDVEEYQWGLRGFVAEARSLALFDHPHIIRVIDSFEENDTAYIVMEYARGRDLSAALAGGLLSVEQTRAIVLPIARGLGAVHGADLLHRDIKPGNIIVREDGNPVLIDFGAARHAIGVRSRSLSTVLTPGYAPIEQYSSRGNQGPWTDIYALSAVAYVCLTGENLSHYEATERIRSDDLPPLSGRISGGDTGFLEAIDWGLRPEEADRPQSVAEWLEVLEQQSSTAASPGKPGARRQGVAAPTTRVQPASTADSGTDKAPQRFNRVGLAALALSVVVGAAFLYLAQEERHRPAAASVTTTPGPKPDAPVTTPAQPAATPSTTTPENTSPENTTPEPARKRPAQPEPASPPGPSPREQRDFDLARKIDTPEAYTLFLRLHPNGEHAADAAAARRRR